MRAPPRAGPIGVGLCLRPCPEPPGGLSSWLVWRPPGLSPQRLRRPSSPAADAAFLARQQARLPPSSAHAAVLRMQAAGPSPLDRHRGRIGRLRATSGDTTMAQIGTFTRDENGSLRRDDQDPHPQRQGHHQALSTATATRPPTIASPPTVSSSAPAGAGPPRTRAPSTSRSSSTTRPSRLRSTPPSSRATKASTSSSGRDDRPSGASLRARRRYSIT